MPSHLGSLELPHTSPHFLEIRRAVRRHTDMHVVVGLSGGPDSVALLAGTLAEGREVEAICIDHGLQDASAEVAATAAETARALGAAATVLRIDVPSTGSMEANARHARYTALTSAANGRPIWVGHTMDDQAETLLLSALRGHATGMLERSTWEDGATIVRPLLGVRRANTVGACSELGLEVWADPHNDDQSFRRVALRNRLLPELADIIGGDPVPGLAQAAERAAWEADLVRVGVDKQGLGEGIVELEVAQVPPHPALRRAVLAEFIRTNGGRESAATIAAVEQLIVAWRGQGPVAIGKAPGGRRLVVARKNGILAVSVR